MTFPFRKNREWIALIPAMTIPFILSIFYFHLFSDRPFAKFLYGATKIFNLTWPIIGGFLFVKVWIPSFKLKNSKHLKALPLGAISGLIIVLVMLIGLYTPIGDAVYSNSWRIKNKAVEMGFINYYISFSIFLSFFHSLLEEYYWRWFVYGNLRQLVNFYLANLLSGLAFASHHIVILNEYFSIWLGPIFWRISWNWWHHLEYPL